MWVGVHCTYNIPGGATYTLTFFLMKLIRYENKIWPQNLLIGFITLLVSLPVVRAFSKICFFSNNFVVSVSTVNMNVPISEKCVPIF